MILPASLGDLVDQVMIHHIIERLTDRERRVVLAAGDEFAKFPKAMGLLAVNAVRNRHKLIECENAERGVWRYRLTPLGKSVQIVLSRTCEHEGKRDAL